MKKIINANTRFPETQTSGISPVVNGVHVYPLRKGSLGNFVNSSGWALEYHSKVAGFIELRSDPGRWIKRRANSVHIYAPGCYYREDTRKADLPLEESYFILRGGDKCGFERFIAPRHLFASISDPEGKVGSLMRHAGELCEINGEKVFWKVQSLFMEIVQLLSSAVPVGNEEGYWKLKDVEAKISFAEEVEAYLRRNLGKNVKTSDIARYMKVSESSLNHRFKKDTGFSPIARLIEMRIDFVKSLLLKGEKLTTIVEMTGFYDEYHLSKAFKKHTGISPRAFKSRSLKT